METALLALLRGDRLEVATKVCQVRNFRNARSASDTEARLAPGLVVVLDIVLAVREKLFR